MVYEVPYKVRYNVVSPTDSIAIPLVADGI